MDHEVFTGLSRTQIPGQQIGDRTGCEANDGESNSEQKRFGGDQRKQNERFVTTRGYHCGNDRSKRHCAMSVKRHNRKWPEASWEGTQYCCSCILYPLPSAQGVLECALREYADVLYGNHHHGNEGRDHQGVGEWSPYECLNHVWLLDRNNPLPAASTSPTSSRGSPPGISNAKNMIPTARQKVQVEPIRTMKTPPKIGEIPGEI
jgi:hypothetical protein